MSRQRPRKTAADARRQRAQAEPHRQLALVQEEYRHSGPLPAPEVLGKYDEILPGAAQRIILMAEKEQASAIDSRNYAIREIASETRRGQWLAFLVALSAFATAAALGFWGHPFAASVVGGLPVVGLVATFIVGRRPPA